MPYSHPNAALLDDLDNMIQLINPERLPKDSFCNLFSLTEDRCCFNVTSNQFKRIKYFLQTLSSLQPDFWNNSLFLALCMDDWTSDRTEEFSQTEFDEYLTEIDEYYSGIETQKACHQLNFSALEVQQISETAVIAEFHGTQAPINLLMASIEILAEKNAAISIEGLSLEEIKEINTCNKTKECSLLLHMLIPVEKSSRNQSVGADKRRLVSSLINAGIKIIPGDNQYSVNLPACEQRLRTYNYAAIKNALTADHKGPIIYWVGQAHAVETEKCPGIAEILGIQVIDLTGQTPSVGIPLPSAQASYGEHSFFASPTTPQVENAETSKEEALRYI